MIRLICGKNSVLDAIKNKYPIKTLYLIKQPSFSLPHTIKLLILPKEQLDLMTSENHQGFIAEIDDIKYYDLNIIKKELPQKILILDHITDPHNFGAILRTANASGLTYIIFPKERSVTINDTVLKVSSGGFINLKFIKVNSLVASIEKLKKWNFWIYVTNLSAKASDINKINFNYPLALVLGSEKNGVSKSILKMSDQDVYIPLKGTVQSLNVSVAAGIILFKI
ncbi:23S rRNA (guanosine(2251)-2'-O)-methyltransferase RlmB [Mycoplasma iguanae]|uniref:23S rRNA (Guanosine(2251)-2'-O)-methyltransferase RlmB n=1 Tax=Mycoplasma iguanae TaxID=292461 RepID=A0ABY5R7N5_9MOLU|nr:23S rRNA (guanosine(2251)-2'-O)-methyltransferase RlmB [Mycoplasma iguanae]UVD81463.1 23S rRNA (guanosine(2251)-2'-O)-methyltransferase RlmB [Mycoplasma iguanae]